MVKLIKTDIGLIDVSDVINVTIGFFENPFQCVYQIDLYLSPGLEIGLIRKLRFSAL